MYQSKRKVVDLTLVLAVFLLIVTGCTYNAGTSPNSTNGEQNSAKPDNKNSATPAPVATTPSKANSTVKTPAPSAKKLTGSFKKIVQFGKGKSSATFSAFHDGYDLQEYLLGAKAGQTLRVTTDVDFSVDDPSGSTIYDSTTGSKPYTITLPANGDYTVTLAGGRIGVGDYTITFAVY